MPAPPAEPSSGSSAPAPAPARPWRRDVVALLLALAVVAAVAWAASAFTAGRAVPPLAVANAQTAAAQTGAAGRGETAVFAGGCFWGVQGVFQHIKGVHNAVSGYAGGEQATAVYEAVGRGDTGHAEAVSVTFDPQQVSYERLLQVFFSVIHDPTQLDRQGPDFGPQYRSALFPRNEEQARIVQSYIAQLGAAKVFSSPIVTRIEPGKPFFPAEDYHQDFLARHPGHPYIVVHDLPKIAALKRQFPDLYRAEPALVSKAVAGGGSS